jgi:lactate permease
MISPQSIAVATGSTGLVGKESDIFRFTLKHSILLALVIGVMHMLWAYVFKGMVPVYEKLVVAAPAAAKAPGVPVAPTLNAEGLTYLAIFIGVVALVTVMSRVLGKGLVTEGKEAEVHFH